MAGGARRSPPARTSLIEAACGSANDYRFFAAYGLAEHLDYTGIDLTEANIANAKQLFPAVDFRPGDVQQLPLADRSYDWALASDLLEHLSPQAFERAIDEMCRVSRKGVVVIFFRMADEPRHEIRPRRRHHVNRLSKDLIGARFVQHGFNPEFAHVKSVLREEYGFGGYYNNGAWLLVARRTRVPGKGRAQIPADAAAYAVAQLPAPAWTVDPKGTIPVAPFG